MVKSVARNVRKNVQPYHGEIWEDLARRSIAKLRPEGIEWGVGRRWWGTGLDRKPLEIDVVAESVEGKALLIGEARVTLNRRAFERIQRELTRKAMVVPFAKQYDKIIQKIFIVGQDLRRSEQLLFGRDVFRVLS